MIRKGVGHGELALLAVRYARASGTTAATVGQAVDMLFASASRSKRSHLRRIAEMFEHLEDVLGDPAKLSRDLGLEVSEILERDPERLIPALRSFLIERGADARAVASAFVDFAEAYRDEAAGREEDRGSSPASGALGRKIEFRAGSLKCTVKGRVVRLLSPIDLSEVDEARLQRASEAFRAVLEDTD